MITGKKSSFSEYFAVRAFSMYGNINTWVKGKTLYSAISEAIVLFLSICLFWLFEHKKTGKTISDFLIAFIFRIF